MRYPIVFLLLALLSTLWANAQNTEGRSSDFWQEVKLEPVVALQLWGSYTTGEEVFLTDEARYEAVDNRLNFQLRRSRFGFKGRVGERVKFNFLLAADLIGRDLLAGTEGGANNGAFPEVGLWNAFLQWQLSSQHEGVNLVIGYQLPQIGRESITSALRSTSMEKAWSQNYLRRHLVGKGPGRTTGLNLGGLFLREGIGWSYDLGVFNPAMKANEGNSVGAVYAPLLTGRVVAYLGDPESKTYTTSHKINYFGQRRGISLGLAGAWQGESIDFKNNYAYGVDLLANAGPWNLDGEYMVLGRSAYQDFSTVAQTAYLRFSYNFKVGDHWLEPSGMIVQLSGPLEAAEQMNAAALSAFAGEEQIFDFGGNFYFTPKLKVSMHYTFRNGNAGATPAGATFNNYFFQNGVGPILRGDWLGLGVVAVI